MIRRVHVGAVLNAQYGVIPDYTHRMEENSNESKFGRKALCCICEPGELDYIITDKRTKELSMG